MIDALFAYYSRKKEKPLNPDYKPIDAIQGEKFINKKADKLAVIFPGWHTHNFPVDRLSRRLVKRGWAVITYDFHDQIIEPDDDAVVESFRYIRDRISAELQNLSDSGQYAQVHLIGISLGNVPLALVTDLYRDFNSATLVVAGDDLAIDLWHGLRTAYFGPLFQKMHVGVRKLDGEWHELAPANHASHFKGKRVKFVVSLSDKFIRTKYQKRMVDKVTRAGAQVTVKRRRFGHTLTIVRFCLFDPPL